MIDKDGIRTVYQEMLFSQPSPVEDSDIQLQYITRTMPADRRATILDAGCGSGRYALKLSDMGYNHIYAVDLFGQAGWSGVFSYVQASIDELPFPNEYFDFVYANSVIYYLAQPETGIKEFQRVLKPGGRMVITAHTKYSLFTLERILRRAAGFKSVRHLQGVRFYSAAAYASMLRQNGFEVTLIDGYRLSMLAVPLYRRLAILCRRHLKLALPLPHLSPTRSKLAARIKSEVAYHSVLAGHKPQRD